MDNFTRDNNSQLFSMEIDDQAKNTFLEMARWTKFLSILGLIGMGLMIIVGAVVAMVLTSSPAFSSQFGAFANLGAAGIILYFICVAAIMFYPIWAMLKYSTGMKTAIKTNNKQKFNESINYLKGMFKYYGIFMIILLGLYGVMMVISMLAAMGR